MTITHILFIGHLWPEPDSSAAGYRTMALITACKNKGWQISFACAAEQTQWSVNLKALGINCYSIKINNASFDPWISQLNPNFVIFDRFMTEEQFSWRVTKNCPEAIRVLDTSDLHFLRRTRNNSLKLKPNANKTLEQNTLFTKEVDLKNDNSIREISAIYRSDLSLIISSYEMDLLINKFTIDKQLLSYLPFMFDQPKPQLHPPFDQRKHFFMIGNYLHEPNWDAVLWAKNSLWSTIRKALPDAQLHIYGAYTPEKARQLHKPKEGFYIMGRAENLQQLIAKYRVNLVPLRFGAGIKGKIADGFCYGLPCVSTSIGAEGMADGLPWGGYICDQQEEFTQAAIALYTDPKDWQQQSKNGYAIISKIHNKITNQQVFINNLVTLKENIKQYRSQNFIGTMLNYHLHRSHEFMSRWIEAKNS